MKKLAKYINSWDLDRSNPLDESEEAQKLIKVFNAKGIKTKVGYTEISDFAVLKEGNNAWGWKHIIKQNHHNHIKDAFKLQNNNKAVIELIGEALQKGIKGTDSKGATVVFYKPAGARYYLRVVLSKNSPGSIQDAYPQKNFDFK
ncbi:hypothetical protein [Methanothermococcus sp.]|uniref:hypothetical protein n=1 Tax=Methanothermococcus sp. TaxID=2614238 RepID=UPI0025D0616D|nr:hypothetical protein [Methanothermococcus sp.]